jgi:hypothetical protein
MTWCLWRVTKRSLTCFVFPPTLLRSLWCFTGIPECKTDVKLQGEVHDVMHVGSYGKFAHLLHVFSEATSLTIAFQRHPRMQDRRQTKMCSSWRDACGKLWKIRSPASYFLWGYFAHYSVSETSQNARPTSNSNVQFMTWCMWEVMDNSLTCFMFSLRLLRSL